MTIKQNGGVFGRNPTFNNVTIDGDLTVEGAVVHDGDLTVDNINLSGNTISTTNTNGDLLLDPNGTGKVGVNELSPDRTFSVTAAAVIPVRFESTGRDNQLEFANSVGTPKIGSFDDNFLILTGGSETVRVDSSGHVIVPAGVTLGTATGVHTTANTLDDYEEGVWTPTVGGDATYHVQDGYYVKVGTLVYVQGKIQVNVLGTGSATTVSELPFTALNAALSSAGTGSSSYFGTIATNVTTLVPYVNNATATVIFGSLGAAGGIMTGVTTVFQNSARVDFSLSYRSV